jgi:hypothetical protein
MRSLRYFLLPATFFTLLLQSPETLAQVSGKFEDFTLTLATPKTKYLELQPIPIAIESRRIFERLSKNSDRTLATEAAHFLKLIDQREQQKKDRP